MKCNFDCCIYNKDFVCILEAICINSLGMCDDCTTVEVELDKNILEAEKEAYFSLGHIFLY